MRKVYTPSEIERITRLGQIGMLTGDKVLAPFGESEFKRAGMINEQQSDLAERHAQREQMGRYYQAQMDRWAREPQENEKDRQLRLQLERMGLHGEMIIEGLRAARGGANATTDLKPSSAPEQKAREADRLAAEAARLRTAMPEGGVHRGKDVAIDLLSGIKPSLGQLTGSALYSDEENQWRADADRFDQDISNLAAGLAITGFELENKQKWSPRAPGISAEEAGRRFQNLERTFGGRAAAARGTRVPQPPRPSVAGPRNRRVIGGRTYVQVGPDEWVEE